MLTMIQSVSDSIDKTFSSEDARRVLCEALGKASVEVKRARLEAIRSDLSARYSLPNWRIDVVDSVYYANGGAMVGMGATIAGYSDRAAYTVVARNASGSVLTLQRDKVILDSSFKMDWLPGGFSGHVSNQNEQRWFYEPDPSGSTVKVRLRKDGRFYVAGSDKPVTIGIRSEFYDYNF